MVLFFLLVGLEIKRELLEGELNSFDKLILPATCALGGMLVPALIFTAFNSGNDFAMRGWAIPTATDIAFSLGILSLLGSRVPIALKVFLTALAIFDDMGAIVIIAIFYTAKLSYVAITLAIVFIIILVLLNRFNVRGYAPYFITGLFLWLCLLESGVHATLAGVILAMAIPLRNPREPNFSQLGHLLHKLHPWIAYMVLPIFAFANAGVSFDDVPAGVENIFSPVVLGISLGLLIGKLLGVFLTAYLTISLKIAKKPRNATWLQMLGISLICGVGFTMSFFVGTLAFQNPVTSDPYGAWVRLGVIFGSLTAGILGYIVLRYSTKATDKNEM
jgi:NhaA family Na+:H+ antiporter